MTENKNPYIGKITNNATQVVKGKPTSKPGKDGVKTGNDLRTGK
jgi:hypothetical protein